MLFDVKMTHESRIDFNVIMKCIGTLGATM